MIQNEKFEKLAILNNLVKELKPEEKLFSAITNALNEIAEVLESYDEAFDGMAEILADVEESVYELENEVFGEGGSEFDEYGEFGEDIYDITCSSCDNAITVDFDSLDRGTVICSECGEVIEFTIEEDD